MVAVVDQSQYLPVTSDDANRQQQVARSFYLLGDFMRGVDNILRMEPQNVNGTGLLGPSSGGVDVGVGQGGEVFLRGQAGQLGATQNPPPVKPAGMSIMGIELPQLLLIAAAAGAVWWLARRG